MTETTEKAILAGGCFRGMQNLLRKRPASSRPRWLHRRRRPQRHLSPPRHARRGDRDRLRPPADPYGRVCWLARRRSSRSSASVILAA